MNTQRPTNHPLQASLERALSTGEYETNVIDLSEYGTTYEITRTDSDRKLHLTPLDDDMIDMILFDEDGDTLATGTLFPQASPYVTVKGLATIISLAFREEEANA